MENKNMDKLVIECRKQLTLTGVDSVDGFSEQTLNLTVSGVKVKISGENIKIVSEIANLNYLESKKMLESKTAVLIYKVKDEAVREISKPEEIIKIARRLKELSLDFYISPEFKYEI